MSHLTLYEFPSSLLSSFNSTEQTTIRTKFSSLDPTRSGYISVEEVGKLLTDIDEGTSPQELQKILVEKKPSENGKVSFAEFLTIVDTIRKKELHRNVAQFTQFKAPSKANLNVEGSSAHQGVIHTFSDDEKIAFSEHLNNCLSRDPILSKLMPFDIMSNDLFERAHDGLVLCQLINLVVPDTIDERAINKATPAKPLNVYQKTENLNLALNAARGIGCQDLLEGRPILILGLVWQIIKIQLLSNISLKNYPELVVLLNKGEEMESLLKLSSEEILIRWVNYQLKGARSSKKITNFGKDIMDSEVYNILLHHLSSEKCPKLHDTDLRVKAANVVNNARALGAACFIRPNDICSGNKKLNISFVAQIFNVCPNLFIPPEVISTYNFASLEIDDVGDSREERTFRMWMNSLNIEGLYVNNLFSSLEDGVAILKVNIEPKLVFKKIENANYVVTLGKSMGLSLVNIGGMDIAQGSKKIILSIIGQLVSETGKTTAMRNFRDSSLSSGLFFLDLTSAIEPRAINWELVTPGVTPEDKLSNAKYVISVARKIGASVFVSPEDIIEVQSKSLSTFLASLWAADLAHERVDADVDADVDGDCTA
eukprot:gene3796-7544_t